jgi:hypothetical protein
MTHANRLLPAFSAAVIFSLSQIKAIAAPTRTVEPEYIGVFVALDPSSGALIELERHTTTQHTKLKGLGFGGGEGYLEVPGERSPIRFKADAVPPFLVRAASQQADPQSSIRLISWTVEKGSRRVTVATVGPMGIGTKTGVDENLLLFNATRYGESSFKIVPAQPLRPGEYALGRPAGIETHGAGQDSFSFGIDPPGGGKPPSTSLQQAEPESKSRAEPESTVAAKPPGPEKPLTNDDVLAMVKADLGDELTISKIRQAPVVNLDVSTDALIRLKTEGASKAVIQALMKRAEARSPKQIKTPTEKAH